MAQLISHGGHCCGVSHLYLNAGPVDQSVGPSKKFSWSNYEDTGRSVLGYLPRPRNRTGEVKDPSSYPTSAVVYQIPKLALDRPMETSGERADAILEAFCAEGKQGLIEVVVTAGQRTTWGKWLTDRGFVEGVNHINTNSNNRIYMYVLAYGPNKYVRPEAKVEANISVQLGIDVV